MDRSVFIDRSSTVFRDLRADGACWMEHGRHKVMQ